MTIFANAEQQQSLKCYILKRIFFQFLKIYIHESEDITFSIYLTICGF
jgi:hypothetical protein